MFARWRGRRGRMAFRRPDGERLQDRRSELLDLLLRQERDRLIRQARHHSERAQDAEDALGDAGVQFLLHFDGDDGEEARRWMLVVVKRCAWAIARKRRERRSVIEEVSAAWLEMELGVELVNEERGPEELTAASNEVAAFAAALAVLKVDERRAVILLALGLSRREIEERCGWSGSKVNRSLAEGRARLRGLLGEGGDGS